MRPVTRSVGAFEAKTHLAALLDAMAAGEQITPASGSDASDQALQAAATIEGVSLLPG